MINLYITLTPVVAALLVNGVIYATGLNRGSTNKNTRLPPGWAIGAIWVVLFGILGYTLALAYGVKDWILAGFIAALTLLCLLYPFYTRLEKGRVGNVVSLLTAFLVAGVASYRLPMVALYLLPLLGWISYVNFVTI